MTLYFENLTATDGFLSNTTNSDDNATKFVVNDLNQYPLYRYSLTIELINGIIGSIGIVLNVLVVVILTSLREKSFTVAALTWLAVFDCLVCLHFGFRAGILRSSGTVVQHWNSTSCRLVWVASSLLPMCTKYLICCITCERIIAIGCPIFYKSHVSHKTAHLSCAVILVIAITFSVPYWFAYSVLQNEEGVFACSMEPTTWSKAYQRTVRSFLGGVIPVSFVLLGNILLLVLLRRRIEKKKAKKQSGASVDGQLKQRASTASITEETCLGAKSRVTRMLLAVAFTFLVCHSSAVVISWQFSHPVFSNDKWARRYFLFSLANFFLIFSSSCNIFLYFLTNPKLREHLARSLFQLKYRLTF